MNSLRLAVVLSCILGLNACAPLATYVRSRPLLAEQLEPASYGAYSYILFPQSPTKNFRYKSLLAAFVALPPDPYWMGGPFRDHVQSRLNVTMVPIRVDPEQWNRLSLPWLNHIWLAENYDLSGSLAKFSN